MMAEDSVIIKNNEAKIAGIASIKPEYIATNHERTLTVECISEKDKKKLDVEGDEPSCKRAKFDHKNRKLKGQNKSRGNTFIQERASLLCHHLLEGNNSCPFEKCVYLHDTKDYLAKKPPDIGPLCPVYSVRGFCPRGITCRFGSSHIDEEGKNIVDKDLETLWSSNKSLQTLNNLSKCVQIDLRKKKYNFKASEIILSSLDKKKGDKNNFSSSCSDCNGKEEKPIGPVDDSDKISLRKCEIKKVNWRDKLYLSPLTTVGNLPFRRICKEFGVDITCGEMAMATSLLQGKNQEWVLIKKHGTEDTFGVQVCGNNPFTMTRCAQLLQDNAELDFIDINLGCPLDLVYQQGSGSGLLGRESKLASVVECMSNVLNVPLTVKMRTGIYSEKNVAHNLIPRLCKSGASLVTLHGRSREQRYTRSADWEYIERCAQLTGSVPLFGNGDVLSYRDYVEAREKCPSVAGVMIGRGALIKPWIFTEIKEQRLWDISSNERFEILKKYVNYGLEHWGTDTRGVENTRRFLLEWLSFLHRYIPVGLLEYPPQRINERPPYFHGRNELETLMASSNCGDWIKISEMLLGPVPDGFKFLPKHKANSWK